MLQKYSATIIVCITADCSLFAEELQLHSDTELRKRRSYSSARLHLDYRTYFHCLSAEFLIGIGLVCFTFGIVLVNTFVGGEVTIIILHCLSVPERNAKNKTL